MAISGRAASSKFNTTGANLQKALRAIYRDFKIDFEVRHSITSGTVHINEKGNRTLVREVNGELVSGFSALRWYSYLKSLIPQITTDKKIVEEFDPVKEVKDYGTWQLSIPTE